MKAVRLLTHAFAENFMKVGRTTMEYAKNRLRMLLGAAVVLSAGQIAMASPDAGPDKASTADPSAAMQVPPGYTGIGPVEQGSVLFDNIPAKSRKFLQKNCDGHAIVKCEKQFASGDYEISLADGIDMEFDAKGNMTEIETPDGYSLSPQLLRAVVPGKLYRLLEHNGFEQSVEAVHRDRAGYRLAISDPVFDTVCYDSSGVLTLVVDK